MEWLSIQQFATKLHVHRTAIYARIKHGSIKARKVGAYHFIPESEVSKWGIIPTLSKKAKKMFRKDGKK